MNLHLPPFFSTLRFWRRWVGSVFAVVGFLAVILGLVFAIAPNFLPHDRGQVAALVVVISIVAGSIRAWPRSIQARFSKPDMTVQIIEGDLFDQDTHLVIGMCDTFDTSTPVIISQRSIQGQFLDRVLDGNVAELTGNLTRPSRVSLVVEPSKRKGNTCGIRWEPSRHSVTQIIGTSASPIRRWMVETWRGDR